MARKDEPKTVKELHAHMESCREDMDIRFIKGNLKMDDLHRKIDDNTKAVKDLSASINQFLVIWDSLDKFATVVNWIAKGVKVIAIIGAGIAAVWASLHFGWHGK